MSADDEKNHDYSDKFPPGFGLFATGIVVFLTWSHAPDFFYPGYAWVGEAVRVVLLTASLLFFTASYIKYRRVTRAENADDSTG